MKKLLLTLCLAIFFTGCASSAVEEAANFTLSGDEKKTYTAQVQSVLLDHYWKYSTSTLQYAAGRVPEDPAVWDASARSGYPLEDAAGKNCIVATVELLHFSEETAGVCTFYFSGENLLGVYYAAEGAAYPAYALTDRNLYQKDAVPTALESEAPYTNFASYPLSGSLGGFAALTARPEGGALLCMFGDGTITLYQVQGTSVSRTASLSTGSNQPISAAFLPNGELAVLFGTYEQVSEGDPGRILSDHVAFYDTALQESSPSFALDAEDYNCIAVDGNAVVLASGKTLKYYEKTTNGLELTYRQFLGHAVTDFLATDLTGDGVFEYFMLSGLDAYLYHKDGERFLPIWRTHINAPYFCGPVTAGDGNGDGVQELYLMDTSGTAIRYTLGTYGLLSRNEDIDYGEQLIAADYNGDGKTDFLQIIGQMSATLFLAE